MAAFLALGCATPTVRQNVMAVTAICSVVSFLVGGLRDRHLTEATVVLGVVVANRSGDYSTPSIQNLCQRSGVLWRKVMMPADLRRLHKYMLDVEDIGIISDEMRAVVLSLGEISVSLGTVHSSASGLRKQCPI
jgi:hypothetical protein